MRKTTLITKIAGLVLLISISIVTTQAQPLLNVGDFTGIKVGDVFTIVISQSDANTVKIDAEEKILSQIKTEVKEGILNISGEGNMNTDKPMVITIGIKSLTSLSVSGAADVKTENQLICDKLDMESTGVGDVFMDIKANEIITKIKGAGDVTLKGSAQLLDATVSGAGNLKASDLEANKVKVTSSGVGSTKVCAVQAIDADVLGAGSIIYKGNPVERTVTISGVGSVRESKSGTGEETARDTTKFKLGKKKYIIIGDGEEKAELHNKKDSVKNYNTGFKHWAGFEVGVNGLLDYKNSLILPSNATFLELDYSKSIQFGLNLLEKDFHIYKDHINLVTGFGFDFNHYALKNKSTLNPDTSYLSATISTLDYKKNKLNVSYIKVPLMLEINTGKNPKKNFHIAAGLEFAYRIHSVAKQKYDIGDTHFNTKERDDFNLGPFRYSVMARIGYNKLTVFASYDLNRLFQEGKGPQVYPFTVGVTITI